MRGDLPTGTVTFLFTDIEGSTRLLHALGSGAHTEALAEHRRLLRDAFTAHGGAEVDTQGDAFFVAFPMSATEESSRPHGSRASATIPNERRSCGKSSARRESAYPGGTSAGRSLSSGALDDLAKAATTSFEQGLALDPRDAVAIALEDDAQTVP